MKKRTKGAIPWRKRYRRIWKWVKTPWWVPESTYYGSIAKIFWVWNLFLPPTIQLLLGQTDKRIQNIFYPMYWEQYKTQRRHVWQMTGTFVGNECPTPKEWYMKYGRKYVPVYKKHLEEIYKIYLYNPRINISPYEDPISYMHPPAKNQFHVALDFTNWNGITPGESRYYHPLRWGSLYPLDSRWQDELKRYYPIRYPQNRKEFTDEDLVPTTKSYTFWDRPWLRAGLMKEPLLDPTKEEIWRTRQQYWAQHKFRHNKHQVKVFSRWQTTLFRWLRTKKIM